MIEEQRRRLAELKQKAAAEAQCQWDALHGAGPFPAGPSGFPTLMHHSILHHLPAGRERGEESEHAYDTLSLESSDSMETSISTGGNSACSPDNMSRYLTPTLSHLMVPALPSPTPDPPPLPDSSAPRYTQYSPSLLSASGLDVGKIEEMEKMLKEAHVEKSRLVESRVRQTRVPEAEAGAPYCLPPAEGLQSAPSCFIHIILATFPGRKRCKVGIPQVAG